MRRALLPIALLAALAVGGCYDDSPVIYSPGYAPAPSLTYVAPGVQVVADYDYPVFLADGYYWQWSGGYWYRSPYWDRGFVLANTVPYGIRGINRPWAYAHYHTGTYWGGHGGVRGGYVMGNHAGPGAVGYNRGADGYYRTPPNASNTYRVPPRTPAGT